MEYLFYRLWQLLIGKSEEEMPPFASTMIISIFECANFRTLQILIDYFFGIRIETSSENDVIILSLLCNLPILIFNIFFLFRRRHIIKQKFENESILKKKIGNILILLYAIISILSLVIVSNSCPID